MVRRLHLSATILVLVLLVGALPATASDGSSPLHADLDGRQIALERVSDFYCHDFDWPDIHCFATSESLEAAVAEVLGDAGSLGPDVVDPGGSGGTPYIRVFDLSWYAGAYIYLSADYPDLGVIGWNDRISSYTGSNSQSSSLSVNIGYSGSTLLVCCNQKAATLSSTFDNKISSAMRW